MVVTALLLPNSPLRSFSLPALTSARRILPGTRPHAPRLSIPALQSTSLTPPSTSRGRPTRFSFARAAHTAYTAVQPLDTTAIPVGKPLVEFPLHWFELPERLLGSDYVLVPLHIGAQGPYNFLVDTGLTTNLLTPQLCAELNITAQDRGVKGLAGDGNVQVKTLGLRGVYMDGRLEIPKFSAAVIDFPQRGYAAERGIELHGMVGMEFLEQFDMKYEWDEARGADMVSVYRAHEGYEAHLGDPKWHPVRGIVMPARLLGVQIAVDEAPVPFLGLVDTGASHSIMNHEAARLLGYDPNDPQFANGNYVNGVGVLGRETRMPTVPIKVCISSFAEDVQMNLDLGGKWWLTPMQHSSECVGFEFESVAAIGEMNFASLTALSEKGMGPYRGPLVLTGQDILTQRELLISGASKRMMFGAPTGRHTNA